VTLIEFVAPIKGKGKGYVDTALAALLFAELHEGLTGLKAVEVRLRLKAAHVQNADSIDITSVLERAGRYAQPNGSRWSLTTSGRAYIRGQLGLPATDIEKLHDDVSTLQTVVAGISDATIRDYVAEALICLEHGALRACVVFAWTGAIRVIHAKLLGHGGGALNAALKKHDPKARDVSRLDHFAYVEDKATLRAAQELRVLDEAQRDTLEEHLDLRNRCGQPGNYKPGEKEVSGFIEDLVTIMF
jgi:hypothetical protein